MSPEISVIIPAHNEASRLAATVEAIAESRARDSQIEFVIVDDASTDGCTQLAQFTKHRLRDPRIEIRIYRFTDRVGVPQARNWGAKQAAGATLVITDAHVRFVPGWDKLIGEHLRPNRILTGTIKEENTTFRGYGCRLAVPFMGTYWNKGPISAISPVQIASCSGTVISRELFMRLGGYDSGMVLYGGAEPEFSVRAWLNDAEVMVVPQLLVEHRFKPRKERELFVEQARTYMVHNSIRFGLLYLSELSSLQLVSYFARRFPDRLQRAMQMLASSDIWMRKTFLEKQRCRPFEWFVQRFGIKDELGREII